jgi:hypothetical protein
LGRRRNDRPRIWLQTVIVMRGTIGRWLALLATLGGLGAPTAAAAAGPVSYGISDARGAFTTFYATPAFTNLQARMNATGHSLVYVRFFVAWDAIDTWDGNRCAASPALLAGAHGWNVLLTELDEARARGLVPMVSLVEGTEIGGQPSIPTDQDYVCGLQALMRATGAAGLHVPAWEPFNEPDSHIIPVDSHGVSGPQAAAWFYADAVQARANAGARDAADTLVAGTFNGGTLNPNNQVYARNYIDYLTQTLNVWPDTWSFHPYDDVTASYATPQTANTRQLAAYIAQRYAGRAQPEIWLTEVATNLRTTTTKYDGAPISCPSGDPDEQNTIGGCVDGNPAGQANAARAFLTLPQTAAAFPGQITREYWYEFRTATNWDSGLLSADGALRQSYCVLAALPSSSCDSTPHEHSDYTDYGPGSGWDTTH